MNNFELLFYYKLNFNLNPMIFFKLIINYDIY
jgi:hypothetical protein